MRKCMLLLSVMLLISVAAHGAIAHQQVLPGVLSTLLIIPGPLGMPMAVHVDLPLPVMSVCGDDEDDPPPPPPPPPPEEKDLPPVSWGDVKMIYA